MERAILLQTEATESKNRVLAQFLKKVVEETNRILPLRAQHTKFTSFWHSTGPDIKAKTGFNIQVVCDLVRAAWSKQKNCTSVNGVTVKFSVPRNCKTFKTKGFNFVELGLYPGKRIAIPIRTNRNWQRSSCLTGSGWTCKTFGLTPSLELVAYLSKPDVEPSNRTNVLGVDVNSKCFAISVLSRDGKILKQTYLGRDIWERRKKIFERKSLLQSFANTRSRSAKKKLERTKNREHDFVRDRIGEVVKDITQLALEYDAEISIEYLKRFSSKGKNFNRKVMRIPFYTFRKNLESRCFDKGIKLNMVDSWHTSKWCPRCGAVGEGHSASNYSLFKCKQCGFVANSDRKASLAIAAKSLLERRLLPTRETFSLSSRRVPVNGLLRRPHADGESVEVQNRSLSNGRPMTESLG